MNDIDDSVPTELALPALTPDDPAELDALLGVLRKHGVQKFELGMLAITFGEGWAPAVDPKGGAKPAEDKSKLTGLTPTEEKELFGG